MFEGWMMNKPSLQTAPISDGTDSGPLEAMSLRALDRGFASGTGLLDCSHVLSEDVVEFWSGRLACCWKSLGQLAACRSASEALPIQQQYVQELVRDYAALPQQLMAAFVGEDSIAAGSPMDNQPVARPGHAA